MINPLLLVFGASVLSGYAALAVIRTITGWAPGWARKKLLPDDDQTVGPVGRVISVVVGCAFVIAAEYAVVDQLLLRSGDALGQVALLSQLTATMVWIVYLILNANSATKSSGKTHRPS